MVSIVNAPNQSVSPNNSTHQGKPRNGLRVSGGIVNQPGQTQPNNSTHQTTEKPRASGPLIGNSPGNPPNNSTHDPAKPRTPGQMLAQSPMSSSGGYNGSTSVLANRNPVSTSASPMASAAATASPQSAPATPAPGSPGTTIQGSTDSVNVADPNFGSMQKYQDAAYDHAMRSMQPQMDQQNRKFEQTLVNKGIDPNSAAGRDALAQLQRGQNDARNSAMFQAMQFGQGAQNQAFQQGLAASHLAQGDKGMNMQDALARDQMAQQNNQFGQNLNWQKDQFGRSLAEQSRQFDANDQRQYSSMMMDAMQRAYQTDMNNWMQNNAAANNQFNLRQGVAGSIPGWNPAMVDVNGSAGAATNSQQAAFDAQMATDPMNQALQAGTAIGGMMMSDARLKTNVTRIGKVNGHNWYRWDWNGELGLTGSAEGVIAQELPDDYTVKTPSGYLAVDYAKVLS